MNVIARLEYELGYYDSAVHRFNHYTTRTPQEQHWYNLTYSRWDKRVPVFPEIISPKMNAILRLDFKPALQNILVNLIGFVDVSRNIMKTSMNERTHFFRKIYLSHFILERVAQGLMLVVCERWVGDGDRLPHIDPKFFWP